MRKVMAMKATQPARALSLRERVREARVRARMHKCLVAPALTRPSATLSRRERALGLISNVLFRCDHIERKCKRINLVVPPELSPGAIQAGLRHQPFESHIWTATQFFKIRSRRYDELGRTAIVIGFGENVEWMRMDVIHHVFAHDQSVTECTEVGLQIRDRLPADSFGQMKV